MLFDDNDRPANQMAPPYKSEGMNFFHVRSIYAYVYSNPIYYAIAIKQIISMLKCFEIKLLNTFNLVNLISTNHKFVR